MIPSLIKSQEALPSFSTTPTSQPPENPQQMVHATEQVFVEII